jgi:hypothetical protein
MSLRSMLPATRLVSSAAVGDVDADPDPESLLVGTGLPAPLRATQLRAQDPRELP